MRQRNLGEPSQSNFIVIGDLVRNPGDLAVQLLHRCQQVGRFIVLDHQPGIGKIPLKLAPTSK